METDTTYLSWVWFFGDSLAFAYGQREQHEAG